MFVVLQHPFADLRSFVGPSSARLKKPVFPLSTVGKEFIRSSGQIAARRRGGVDEWSGEESFAKGANALRFPNHLGEATFGAPYLAGRLDCAFRRFHSNGHVARWEVGLSLAEAATPLDSDHLAALIREVSDIPTCVASEKKANKLRSLADAGNALAEHYLLATSRRKPFAPSVDRWWFQAGDPMFLVELWRREDAQAFLPPHVRPVLSANKDGIDVFHGWLQLRNRRSSAWFINLRPKLDLDFVRRLRIHLVRMHAERHCLRTVLQRIEDGSLVLRKGDDATKLVEDYLNRAIALLEKPRMYGFNQKAILAAAKHAFGVAFEGEGASLREMRHQVVLKVRRFVEQEQKSSYVVQHIYKGPVVNKTINVGDVSVSGDFTIVTAENIQNSFNKATTSDAAPELKEALKNLAAQVAELAKQLPQAKAEQVSADLQTLTAEALSKDPRKKWYEMSADGLLDAAKTVTAMLPSIESSVQAVLKIIRP